MLLRIMLLSNLKVFDKFELLDFSSTGIDTIANIKIDKDSQTQINKLLNLNM